MNAGTVRPGSFCSPEGGTGSTTKGTSMVCSVGPKGGRARWRSGTGGGAVSAPLSTVDNVVTLEPEPEPIRLDPAAGEATPGTDGHAEQAVATPGAVGQKLLDLVAKIRNSPDHGITADHARELLRGLTVQQLKTVCDDIGFPADYRHSTKKALTDHIVHSSVVLNLDYYAINPSWNVDASTLGSASWREQQRRP